MKKLLLLAFICLSFATMSLAQTGWYLETTKFDKYVPKPNGTYNIQNRYDHMGNMTLAYDRKINNTIIINVMDYDAMNDLTDSVRFAVHKDIDQKNPYRYLVDKIDGTSIAYDKRGNAIKITTYKNLNEKEFSGVVQKIMDRLDQK